MCLVTRIKMVFNFEIQFFGVSKTIYFQVNLYVIIKKTISILLDEIEKIIMDEEINYCRLNNGLQTKRHTSQYLIDRSNYICKIQDDLENGLTIKYFLKMFPKSFEELQFTIKKLITDCELLLIDDDPDPSTLDIFCDTKKKGEDTSSIHKSLKHLENVTNKIESRLNSGKVNVNNWLQRKKKGRKRRKIITEPKASDKLLKI